MIATKSLNYSTFGRSLGAISNGGIGVNCNYITRCIAKVAGAKNADALGESLADKTDKVYPGMINNLGRSTMPWVTTVSKASGGALGIAADILCPIANVADDLKAIGVISELLWVQRIANANGLKEEAIKNLKSRLPNLRNPRRRGGR